MGLDVDPIRSTLVVGFFKLVSTSGQDGFLGALLVTDLLSKPLEFRVTLPVKPNTVQRTIYGISLIPHIGVDLCGKPLYEMLTTKPSLLFIDDERLLSLSQAIPGRVVLIRPAADARDLPESEQGEAQRVTLTAPSEHRSSVSVFFPSHYDSIARRETRQWVEAAFDRIDLLEPFQRIENAVRVLAQEDERFR